MRDRTAVVTGVSRLNGIGYGIADRLAAMGCDLMLQGFRAYDDAIPSVAPKESMSDILQSLRRHGTQIAHKELDFRQEDAPRTLIAEAVELYGGVDILVVNHVHDALKSLDELTASEIDLHLQVNVRAPLLLLKHFDRQHGGRDGGRIVLLTSGQHLGPMPHLAYVASKGALHQLTVSLSARLMQKGVTVNTVNPGPTRTYEPDAELDAAVLAKMPRGRWGTPEDAARLIGWLVSDEASWITGQVIDSEGGFQRG